MYVFIIRQVVNFFFNIVEDIQSEIKSDLMYFFETSSELLRHFWSAQKNLNAPITPQHKLFRVHNSIDVLYKKIRWEIEDIFFGFVF